MKSDINMIRRIISEELESILSESKINETHQGVDVKALLDDLRAMLIGSDYLDEAQVYSIQRQLISAGIPKRKAVLVTEAALTTFEQPEGVLFDDGLNEFDEIVADILEYYVTKPQVWDY